MVRLPQPKLSSLSNDNCAANLWLSCQPARTLSNLCVRVCGGGGGGGGGGGAEGVEEEEVALLFSRPPWPGVKPD